MEFNLVQARELEWPREGLRGSGMRTALRLATQLRRRPRASLAGILVFTAFPAYATVLEYDSEGALTVTETLPEARAAEVPAEPATNVNRAHLRELARTIALRFSGEPGVRKAGLNALTFIEIFEALIDAESSFDPDEVSPKGAMGLGQLMPSTAQDLKVSDPFDPQQNLLGSAQYLTNLLQDFGSLELALAAYNAGPERVKEHKGIPPYKETHAYIARIFQAAGLGTDKSPNTSPPAPSVPINREQPLKGDASVWEF